jgi:hypothetical protein
MASQPRRNPRRTKPHASESDVAPKIPVLPPAGEDLGRGDAAADNERSPSPAVFAAIDADMAERNSAERLWSALREAYRQKLRPLSLLSYTPPASGTIDLDSIRGWVQRIVDNGIESSYPEGFWEQPRTVAEARRFLDGVNRWITAHAAPSEDHGTTPADGRRAHRGRANKGQATRAPAGGDGAPNGPEAGNSNGGPTQIIIAGYTAKALAQRRTAAAKDPATPSDPPTKRKRDAGRPEIYAPVRALVKRHRESDPDITWKDLLQKVREGLKGDGDRLPESSEHLRKICRYRPKSKKRRRA